MISIPSNMGKYPEKLKDSIAVDICGPREKKLDFDAKSSYEEYIITYFSDYAQYYFLNQTVKSYEKNGKEKFTDAYEAYCKKENKYTESKEAFYHRIKKRAQTVKETLGEQQIPWKAHVIPRRLEDAKQYVTFLVETYQEMKYLFSRSNFVFAYENSSNLVITNHEKLWSQIKTQKETQQMREATDTDAVTFAYYNSKDYAEYSTLLNDSFLMSGNVIEKMKNIGSSYNQGSFQICVGVDLAGVRAQKYKEDVFTIQYVDSGEKVELFQRGQVLFCSGTVVFLVVFILLVMMCGYSRKKDGYALMWYDKIWLEIELFIGFVLMSMITWFLKIWNGEDIQVFIIACGLVVTVLLFCCMGILFSLIKRIKLKCFVEYSLILLFGREVLFRKVKLRAWIQNIKKRVAFIAPKIKYRFLFLYELVILLFILTSAVFIKADSEVTISDFMTSALGISGIIMGLSLFVLVLFWQRNSFLSEEASLMIIQGTKKITNGDLEYQLPKIDGMGYRETVLIDTINHIGEVLEKAVEESLRSERMKTELIANVSHDIKTPLTSVINYVDLLKRQNIQDSEVQKYLSVLERKSLRLKTLIEDLVEVSKASSGAMELDIHTLNFNELIIQTNGEFEDRYEECKIDLVSEIPEEPLYFQGDGRRVFRILENLYNNTAKYAMPDTRVYVRLERIEKSLVFSMKNVSAMKLNITPEELTERFVRGDRARTTEGSGLGLSIAKSLTELMGGNFKIELDGDLFCAKVCFLENIEADDTVVR